jgi:hypothetical protein
MFEYDAFTSRNADLIAEAARYRLVREARRANRNRRNGEPRRPERRGSVRRMLHLAAR